MTADKPLWQSPWWLRPTHPLSHSRQLYFGDSIRRVKQHLHVRVDTQLRLYFIRRAVHCWDCSYEVPDGLVISTEHQCESVKRQGRTLRGRRNALQRLTHGPDALNNGAVPLHYSPTDRIMESFSRNRDAALSPLSPFLALPPGE
jgi:hypothetical protein